MKITNAKIGVAGAALAAAFLGGVALAPSLVSSAAAQFTGNVAPLVENRGGIGTDLFQAAATYIGITVDQLRTEMGTDKSMADVAVAHGKTRDGLVAALVAAETANINTRIGQLVDQKGFPQRGPGIRAEVMIKVDALQTASTYLGISVADLETQLRSGKTLGEIAAATAGKTKDGLVAAIVAAETTQIEKAVADGKLTADQATKLKTGLTERVTQMVDRTGLHGAPGFDFHFGFGPRGGRP
jgi:hypothetical protein